MNCKICNRSDLYTETARDGVCAICKQIHIGGLPTTPQRIEEARQRLGLKEGEFLQQDNAGIAREILDAGRRGRRRGGRR